MQLIRSPGPYYVPAAINDDIDFIGKKIFIHPILTIAGGVVRFPRHNHVKRVKQSARQQGGVDPIYIKQAFNIPANIQVFLFPFTNILCELRDKATITAKQLLNLQSINNTSVQGIKCCCFLKITCSSDLTSFQQNYNLQQQQPTVYGANQASNPGDEDML